MYFAVYLMLFLAGAVAVDSLEERISRIEEKMNEFTSRVEEALVNMGEDIRALQRKNTIESDENSSDDDNRSPEERLQALEFQMTDVHDDVEDLISEVTIIHADQVTQKECLEDGVKQV